MFDFSRKLTDRRLQDFADLLLDLDEQIGYPVSSRGWCYILEQSGAITKAEFDKVEQWVNRCRKRGVLPIDFVAEEAARKFQGVETPSEVSPVQDMTGWLTGLQNCEEYYNVDWWDGEEYYLQMVVEKVDLVTLFRPVCAQYHIPIANSRGWSSMLQRAEYARRFKEARSKGLKCVLLYCGDHDPDGLRISEFLRKNLRDLKDIYWSDGTRGYNPISLHIYRFGLNYDFIQQNGFTWIDNLITGSGKDLSDPTHRNHYKDYVQEYLDAVGPRKCEANLLVTNRSVAEELCRDAIEKYLGVDARGRFAERRQAVREYVRDFRSLTGLDDALAKVEVQIENEDIIMHDRSWLVE